MPSEKITIKDVAREAGVSVTTVSRALNNAGRIDAQTKKHIEEVILRLGYRPNIAAQSLKTQTSKTIFLVVPDVTNPFYADLAKNLQILAKDRKYSITLYNTNENLNEELAAVQMAGDTCAGGIVFASISSHQCILDALNEIGIPSVLLNSFGKCDFDTVHGEFALGTLISTNYLIAQGHRRIAFAGAPTESIVGYSRKEGYLKALRQAGLPCDDKLSFEMGFNEDAGYKAGKYFTALKPRPTAICCANDNVAVGVLNALHEDGIRVPEEISVVGMDNIIYSRISQPPLTTVTNDSRLFAENAASMLFERIEQKYKGKPREIIIERELVIRDSVAKAE